MAVENTYLNTHKIQSVTHHSAHMSCNLEANASCESERAERERRRVRKNERVRDEREIEDEIRRARVQKRGGRRRMVRDEEQKRARWRDWCG